MNPEQRVRSSIYLLPNLITATSIFFGLLAIKYSIDGRLLHDASQFIYAAYAILAAGVCDGLDGSIARLTRTQSSFGVQLDSLCDLVSFGAAPAFVAYNFGLYEFSRLGFCVVFIYTACGALRLARFNVQSSKGKANGNFSGIPIPMAAAPIAVFILAQGEFTSWLKQDRSSWEMILARTLTQPEIRNVTLLIVVFLLSLGMVSTFEYISHKSLRLPRKRPFRFLVAILILGALFFNLQLIVSTAILLLIYCLHGPILWVFTRKDRAALDDEIFESDTDEHTQLK